MNLDEFNKILEISIQFFKNNKSIEFLSRNPYYENSCWGLISMTYHGKYNQNTSKKIYQWWLRDTKNYKTIISRNLITNNYKLSEEKSLDAETNCSISLESFEWQNLQQFISKEKRRRFLSGFHFKLNGLIQKTTSLNCWFKNVYNWFKSEKNYNQTPSPFWRGGYKCDHCGNKMHAEIKSESTQDVVIIAVNWEKQSNHPKIIKNKRIEGEERKEYENLLAKDSVENIKNNLKINHHQNSGIFYH